LQRYLSSETETISQISYTLSKCSGAPLSTTIKNTLKPCFSDHLGIQRRWM